MPVTRAMARDAAPAPTPSTTEPNLKIPRFDQVARLLSEAAAPVFTKDDCVGILQNLVVFCAETSPALLENLFKEDQVTGLNVYHENQPSQMPQKNWQWVLSLSSNGHTLTTPELVWGKSKAVEMSRLMAASSDDSPAEANPVRCIIAYWVHKLYQTLRPNLLFLELPERVRRAHYQFILWKGYRWLTWEEKTMKELTKYVKEFRSAQNPSKTVGVPPKKRAKLGKMDVKKSGHAKLCKEFCEAVGNDKNRLEMYLKSSFNGTLQEFAEGAILEVTKEPTNSGKLSMKQAQLQNTVLQQSKLPVASTSSAVQPASTVQESNEDSELEITKPATDTEKVNLEKAEGKEPVVEQSELPVTQASLAVNVKPSFNGNRQEFSTNDTDVSTEVTDDSDEPSDIDLVDLDQAEKKEAILKQSESPVASASSTLQPASSIQQFSKDSVLEVTKAQTNQLNLDKAGKKEPVIETSELQGASSLPAFKKGGVRFFSIKEEEYKNLQLKLAKLSVFKIIHKPIYKR